MWDEAFYHLPELARYGPGLPGLATIRASGVAFGPLFYALFANLAAPFGHSLLALRLLILACAAANLVLFGLIARRAAGPRAAALVLLLVTFPYFLTLSGLFMSEQPTLLAGLAALLLYLRWRDRARETAGLVPDERHRSVPGNGALIGCLVCATIAVLMRQSFIFLPLALAVHELAFALRTTDSVRARLGRAALLALPAFALVPLALLWGGLVPPAMQGRHAPGFSLAGLSSFLIWTGFYCLPWLFLRVRRTAPGAWLLLSLVALPVAIAAPLPGSGIVRTLFGLLPADALPVLAGVCAVLGAATVISIARGLRTAAGPQRVATIGFLAVGLVLASSGSLVFERYYLPALPLALLALACDIRPLPALAWSLAVQLPLAVVQLLRLSGK